MKGSWLPVPTSAVFKCSCSQVFLKAQSLLCLASNSHNLPLEAASECRMNEISKTVLWTWKGVCVSQKLGCSRLGLRDCSTEFQDTEFWIFSPWWELTRPCREETCRGKVSCDLGTAPVVITLPFPSCFHSLTQCSTWATNRAEATQATLSFAMQPWVNFMGKLSVHWGKQKPCCHC